MCVTKPPFKNDIIILYNIRPSLKQQKLSWNGHLQKLSWSFGCSQEIGGGSL